MKQFLQVYSLRRPLLFTPNEDVFLLSFCNIQADIHPHKEDTGYVSDIGDVWVNVCSEGCEMCLKHVLGKVF